MNNNMYPLLTDNRRQSLCSGIPRQSLGTRNYQLSIVNYQLSIVNYQLSII
jgi:hypothetical protein